MDIDEIWKQSLAGIAGKVGSSVFELWFKPIKSIGLKDQVLTLEIPNRFFKEWIDDTYPNLIKETVESFTGFPVTVKFKPEERQDGAQKRITDKLELKKNRLASKGIYLNPKYTFDNFVTGSSNQFAHAAAAAVAEAPGKTYNPLFIYGGVGLGKTHLMHAIGNKVLGSRADVSVLYVSSEQFTNEVVAAIRHERMADLKEKYRNLDLLLLDDVQFIAGKEATQTEFFYTFNALYEKQKQIVISCDRPPREISDITDRLRSRFNMGLIADIQPPDTETKIAIIYKKAEMMAIRNIPDEVVQLLATRIKSNIRELEGSLIRIAAQSSLTGEPISLDNTRKILRDLIHDDERPVTIEKVQKAVCDYYSLKLSDIKAKRRTKDIALPRQVAMYLAKQVTGAALSEIGNAFGGKDHATVIYACRQIEDRRARDESFSRMLEHILTKIKT